MKLAFEVFDNCEKANSIYPSDEVRKDLRERHLLEARASLLALDAHMSDVYSLMRLNPQGAFTSSNGKPIPGDVAMRRLDKMAEGLGERIDKETGYITNLLKSDKKRKGSSSQQI